MDTSKRTKRQTIQWTLVSGQKDRKYNGHQLANKKTDNTMDTSKRTQRQTLQRLLVNGQKTDNTTVTSKRTKYRQYNGHQ